MDFATMRSRLRPERIPPIPAISAALLLGLVVPFLANVEHRPTEFSLALARTRLESFQGAPRTPAPQGEIFSERPAFHWDAVPGAASYSFRLGVVDGDDWITPVTTALPRFLVRPPGKLESEKRYRYAIGALDPAGSPVGAPQTGEFQRVDPPPALAGTIARARRFAKGAELSLVLAGIFAEAGASDDVASCLETYLDASPAGSDARLAETVLHRLGRGRPAA